MSTSSPLAPYDSPPGDPTAEPDEAGRSARRVTGVGDPPTRSVAVGVDGGECALAAVRWAAEEAGHRGVPLRIVHAAPYLSGDLSPGSVPPELPRARRITSQAYTVARHTGARTSAETEVVPDGPVPALLRAGATAQLLVLGIATTGAADEMVLAPVAQRVVSRSTIPVVVVPRPRGPDAPGRPVVAVLGLGDADDDRPVTEFAADAARRRGVPLLVLRTRPDAAGGQGDGLPADLDVRILDLPDASPRDLLHAACPSPLLVLSVGNHGFLHRYLDGPHRWLLRHCTSPIALLPPARRREAVTGTDDVASG